MFVVVTFFLLCILLFDCNTGGSSYLVIVQYCTEVDDR